MNARVEVSTPDYVEVKGFCSWNERLSKGVDAVALMKLLTRLLPDELQRYVRPLTLRGLRNYRIQIPVTTRVMREVKGIWSDAMKTKRACGPDLCELFVTLQKSP